MIWKSQYQNNSNVYILLELSTGEQNIQDVSKYHSETHLLKTHICIVICK